MQDEPKGAPVDRTRAIVEEAEKLAVEFGAFSPPSWDYIGDCIGIGRAVAIKRVFDAVGMKSPALQWQSDPPASDGTYWTRAKSDRGSPQLVTIETGPDGRWAFYYGSDLARPMAMQSFSMCEWFPIPLERP